MRAQQLREEIEQKLKPLDKNSWFVANCFDHVMTMHASRKTTNTKFSPIQLPFVVTDPTQPSHGSTNMRVNVWQAIGEFIGGKRLRVMQMYPEQKSRKKYQCFEPAGPSSTDSKKKCV